MLEVSSESVKTGQRHTITDLYSVHGEGFNSVIKQESCGSFMLVMKKLS